MTWARLLLTANILVGVAFWLGRNEWSHRYIRAVTRQMAQLTPWYRTNQLLQALLTEVKDSSGRPLREALEHLGKGLDVVQATLAMIHVRQRMYDRLLDNATITTDEKGKLTWASQGFLQMCGCTLEEVQNDGWIASIHQDDRAMVVAEWRQAVADGRDFILAYRYRACDDGRVTSVKAHAYAARASQASRPVGWVAIVREVAPPSPPVKPPVEPRAPAWNLPLDRERRCYRPAGEDEAAA